MDVVDLIPEFVDIVRGSRTPIDFKARFWSWVDAQREGALAPLLDDMIRLWSGVPSAPSLADARAVADRLAARGDRVARVHRIIARHAEVVGRSPDGRVVLLAGMRRPEGYSRFDRGRNTVFLGLDNPNSLAQEDHLDVILSHELTHSVRDPSPAVLADYGGWPEMTHDDFVARHPFREHLVSEGLATAVSERSYPGKGAARYVFFDAEDYAWAESHRRAIADRMLQALADGEDYRTFYARGSVTPDSPDCCDYYMGFHLGRFALDREAASTLLSMPAKEFLDRFLTEFVAEFVEGPPLVIPTARATTAPAVLPVLPETSSMLPASVRHFHADLAAEIAARPEVIAADTDAFRAAVAREGLEYAGAPYDVWPFPLALSGEDARYLRWVAERVLGTVEKVVEIYQRDAALRAYYGFPQHLDHLARVEPGYRPFVPVGRFDAFWNGKDVRFIELNTNGTAAIVLADRIGPLYTELPHAAAVARRHRVRTLRLVDTLIATILECWHQVAGEAAPRPRVAIVDWNGLPTANELAQIRESLVAAGVPAVVADPAELTFDGTRLRARGEPIDVVYRRLTLDDVLYRADRMGALLEACAAGKVVPIGGFGADVAHSKRTFAVLTHERWRESFSPEERALLDAHVPWTRMFRPGPTLWGGRLRDLDELALAEQDRFVLKPAEGQEGRDVVLGVELTAVQWEREVARRFGRDQVIQERIEAPVRELLLPRDGKVVPTPLNVHLGEFVFGGSLAGFLARASTSLVLSARSDDHALPVLLLADEEDEDRTTDLAHP